MLHFEFDQMATAYDNDTIAAYTAELGGRERLTVFFGIDYEHATVRSVIHLRREHDDALTTRTRDWPAIEAVLPRRYWPVDLCHTAKGEHPQLAAFERRAREVAEEHFTAMRAEDALYADDDD